MSGKDFDYHEYLQSPAWAALRRRVLLRDRYFCQGCLSRNASEVHHLTYDNVGAEYLWQLVAVCKQCHHRLHGLEDQHAST